MQTNVLTFTAPASAPPPGFVHQADAALRACHELAVVLVTENPTGWLAAATACWSRCSVLGRGTSRRELESLRRRLLLSAFGLRKAACLPERTDGERAFAAAAARKVEASAALVGHRIRGRA